MFRKRDKTSLEYRRKRGRRLAWASPGYSTCGRCGTPWNHTQRHSTEYSETEGCFPLCEACWSELTPEQRLPYYVKMIFGWEQYGPVEQEKVAAIREAVLAGK